MNRLQSECGDQCASSDTEESVSLAEILITEELTRRSARAADYEAENRALAELAAELAANPRNLLHKLVETAVSLCRAESAGVSIFRSTADESLCHLAAIAGPFACHQGASIPLALSPCGTMRDYESILLMDRPARYFRVLAAFQPAVVENLIIPFAVDGKVIGSVWALIHGGDLRFDAEDARILRSLARFAAAGYQVVDSLEMTSALRDAWDRQMHELAEAPDVTCVAAGGQDARDDLEVRVAERTRELQHRADQLARLTSELTFSDQRERWRLAQILHDQLQQMLVGAKLGLDVLSRRVNRANVESIEKAIRLIDDAIATSRSLTLELSPPILHEAGLVAGIEWLSRTMSAKHGLDVALHLSDDLALDCEDVQVLVFEAIRELLFNVVQHAQTKAAVVTLSRENEAYMRVTVEDEGCGFDPAETMKQARRVTGGFGLFSISERLSVLGGRLHVESKPGVGSCLTILAPLRAAGGADKLLASEAPQASALAARASAIASAQGPIRLLIADDHVVVRQGLTALLAEEHGVDVIGEAVDGIDALQQARKLNPDIVLMDFSMPGMDGVEATRLLRQEMPHIQVIGLSMYEEPDRARAIIEAGAAAYLTKSGNPKILLKTIREIFVKASAGREQAAEQEGVASVISPAR